MSFFSDLFEGNFGNLGTDISHAGSSLINHPDELAETLGAGALVAAPFLLPELGAALGGGLGIGAAEGAGAEAGLAAADEAFGAFDAGAFAAETGAADIGLGAADLGGLNAAFGAFDPGLFASNSIDAASGFGGADLASADFALPETSSLTSSSPDFAETDAELSGGQTGTAPPAAAGGPGAAPTGAGASTTPAGFASTDAELSGGITGAGGATAPAAAPGGFSSLVQGAGGWGNIAKWGLAGAPLALTLAMGQGGLPSSAQALQNQANALSVQGQQDLSAARAGTLNAGQTAQLGQMRQDLTNQWRQTLYNQGVTDITKDARWPQIEAQIDAQVTQQTATLIQQNITNALAETGQASQALTSIAQMQLSQDQNFTNQLIGATKSLGLAAALSGPNAPKVQQVVNA